MKRRFKLQDLDCANCAARVEETIKRIRGVSDTTVSFMTQGVTIKTDDGRFDETVKEVVSVCRGAESDCVI